MCDVCLGVSGHRECVISVLVLVDIENVLCLSWC